APGFALVVRHATQEEVDSGAPERRFEVVDERSGARQRVEVRLDSAAWAAMRERFPDVVDDNGTPDFSTYVEKTYTDGRRVWLALGMNTGSAPAVGTHPGAIVELDLATGRSRSLVHPAFALADTYDFAAAGGVLWIAAQCTEYDEEERNRTRCYGETAGLVRYDPGAGSFTLLDADGSRLPGHTVYAIEAEGDTLWIAADGGLARLDARAGRWDVRWFDLTVRGAELTQELSAARPNDDELQSRIWQLMEYVAPTDRAAFADSALHADRDSLSAYAPVEPDPRRYADSAYMEDNDDEQAAHVAAALSHPAFRPFLVDALDEPRVQRAGAIALWAIGDSTPTRARLHALLAERGGRATERTARTAVLLDYLGDSAGRRWVRARLRDSTPSDSALRWTLWAATRLPDPANATRLIRLMPTRYAEPAFAAVTHLQRPELNGAAITAGAANRALWEPVVMYYAGERWEDPLPDERERRPFVALLFRILRTPDTTLDLPHGSLWLTAGSHLAALAGARDIPALIELLTVGARGEGFYGAMPGLVRLTGLADAPKLRADDPADRVRAQRFWRDWWARHRATFKQAPDDEGRAAMRKWRGY
ncbi:MAG TPA: hypothetical protein VKA84_01145, partial [Gemmatimonadaceae bacterium]|nr:hypothetical protein [Gemmatimonadaceae bacterium]